eukprot:427349_1
MACAVDFDAPITKIKKQIEKQTGYDARKQTLSYGNELLADDKTLKYYKISRHDELRLITVYKLPVVTQIFIKYGDDDMINLFVKRKWKVSKIKKILQKKIKTEMTKQILMLDQKQLHNDDTLEDCNIYDTDTIILKSHEAANETDYKKSDDDKHKLIQILKRNNLYDDLYDLLQHDEIDMTTLENDINFNDIDRFCSEYHLNEQQKSKFLKLMKIIKNNSYGIYKHRNDKRHLHCDWKMQAIIIGDCGVGKTSLIKRYVTGEFNVDAERNVCVDSMWKKERLSDDSVMNITIWDTAGQEKYASLGRTFFRNKDCVIICFDLSNSESFENVNDWREMIDLHSVDNDSCVVILVGCKYDLTPTSRAEFEIKAENIRQQEQWKKYNTKYCECSARTGENVENVFRTAAELVLEHKKQYQKIHWKNKSENINVEKCSQLAIDTSYMSQCCGL